MLKDPEHPVTPGSQSIEKMQITRIRTYGWWESRHSTQRNVKTQLECPDCEPHCVCMRGLSSRWGQKAAQFVNAAVLLVVNINFEKHQPHSQSQCRWWTSKASQQTWADIEMWSTTRGAFGQIFLKYKEGCGQWMHLYQSKMLCLCWDCIAPN